MPARRILLLLTVIGLSTLPFGLAWGQANRLREDSKRERDRLGNSEQKEKVIESFGQMGRTLSWFFSPDENGKHGYGHIYSVGSSLRLLEIHGPHKLALDDKERFPAFVKQFERKLSEQVEKVIGTCFVSSLKEYTARYGDFPLAGNEGPASMGVGIPGVNFGHIDGRACATLTATYWRDHARGTVVLHVSMEPAYAVLTVVEDVHW
jgi:hypothetical protein